jgi:hypothetical protein
VCIVDDDSKEVERAKRYLQGSNFFVGAGQSVEAAIQDLQRQGGPKRPHVFLVDMYGPEERSDPTADQKLAESRAKYLKEEARFYSNLDSIGQTTKRGFRNVGLVRSKYKLCRIPVAFFTRKGTLDNVLDAYEQFPECPVLKKPDPGPNRILSASQNLTGNELDQLYDEAFEEAKSRIAEDIELVVQRFSWRSRYGDLLIGVLLGVVASLLAGLLSVLVGYLSDGEVVRQVLDKLGSFHVLRTSRNRNVSL